MSIKSLFAALALSLTSLAYAEVPSCFHDLERNFFRTDYVNEALSLQGIGQSNWAIINTELRGQIKRVPEMVKQRAKYLSPNPLESPFDPVGAEALLDGVLLDVLAETLQIFQITNRSRAEEMYAYIKEKQIDRFHHCFR